MEKFRGLAVVESNDLAAGLRFAISLAQDMVDPRYVQDDAVWVSPEGGSWGIDQVREEILYHASLNALGDLKVIVVEQAHMMNQRTSDLLLKTLEEPSASVLFVFCVPRVEELATTIQGRVQAVYSPPRRSNESILKELTDVGWDGGASDFMVQFFKDSSLASASLSKEVAQAVSHLDAARASKPSVTKGLDLHRESLAVAAACRDSGAEGDIKKLHQQVVYALLWCERHVLESAPPPERDAAQRWCDKLDALKTAQRYLTLNMSREHVLVAAYRV